MKPKILILVIILIVVISIANIVLTLLAYDCQQRKGKERPYHNISLYTAEGDTIFDIESDSESIKIWIEEDGELDVWTYSNEGWWIRQEK